MRLSELQSLDPQKSIPEPPEVTSDGQSGDSSLPGLDTGSGGPPMGGDPSGGGGGLLG